MGRWGRESVGRDTRSGLKVLRAKDGAVPLALDRRPRLDLDPQALRRRGPAAAASGGGVGDNQGAVEADVVGGLQDRSLLRREPAGGIGAGRGRG